MSRSMVRMVKTVTLMNKRPSDSSHTIMRLFYVKLQASLLGADFTGLHFERKRLQQSSMQFWPEASFCADDRLDLT